MFALVIIKIPLPSSNNFFKIFLEYEMLVKVLFSETELVEHFIFYQIMTKFNISHYDLVNFCFTSMAYFSKWASKNYFSIEKIISQREHKKSF